jgi:16S rRNA (uracil1498-N3)-methyltransferase
VTGLLAGPLALDPGSSRYVHRVHRKGIGDPLLLIDHGARTQADGVITAVEPSVLVDVGAPVSVQARPRLEIIVLQALGKADKVDAIARDLTEIGAARLIPIITRRTIVDLAGKEEARLARWRRVVVEAARQACRSDLLVIDGVLPLAKALVSVDADVRLVLAPNADARLADVVVPEGGSVALLVGPEGGLDPAEIKAAEAAGWQTVSTGGGVLRTETAGPAVAAALLYR